MSETSGPHADATDLVKELLARLEATDVRELEVSTGDLRVRVSRDGAAQTTAAAPVAAAADPVSAPAAAGGPAMATVVTAGAAAKAADAIVAPLTGIFYRSASPQSPPFVQPGSVVNAGDVIGLIEAMKLFNEIRSTKSGTVRRVVAENGQLVRAKQTLVELDPA
ncbi:MAG: acetyl-CoA carboxylase biotin carboxyl carrier protein [Candidatus Limnocylindrales bacterium]